VRSRVLQRAGASLEVAAPQRGASQRLLDGRCSGELPRTLSADVEAGAVPQAEAPASTLSQRLLRALQFPPRRSLQRESWTLRGGAALEQAPIADLYPATTVLFADCCGFTAWAASVNPARVLTVLEAIFNAFDELAAQAGVFKVETSKKAAAPLRACFACVPACVQLR
jgi:hypothetical protein